MRLLEKMCFVVLASGLAMGQATATNSGSADTGSVADELKALREAISQQQKQISQQQQQIQTLQQQLETKTSGTPHVADASMRTVPVPVKATVTQEVEKPKESPLSFRIGGTEFTPGGFVDFENIFRSTNTGGSSATTFGAIPFSNTVAGHLTEYRITGQYSRYNLKVSGKYGANNVVGYLEGDFNGNDATNVFVTSNSHTNRIRLYWLDLKRGKWEFLAGQSWGLETPNRKGLSPNPADLMLTIGEDANVHVGVPYTRAGLFRAVLHPNDNFAWGVEVQNPQQFIGAGEVVFPFAFNAQLGTQFDTGATPGTPNAFPDIITKMAWDTGKERGIHLELGAMMTSAKFTVLPVGGTNFSNHSKIGGGVLGGVNVSLAKSFRVIGHGMWGNGIGRYMIGSGPNAIVFPVATGPGAFDANLSLVHSGSAIVGAETTAGKSQFGFQRNFAPDPTNPVPGRFVGFGAVNSPNSANRSIQEGSIEWTQTFWRNPQYGAILMVTQASYLTRSPWFVAAGAPKNAHLGMGYLSIRYVLP